MRLRQWLGAALLLVATGGVGLAAISNWRSNRQACATASEFADSVAANARRLAAIDSMLARYEMTTPPEKDSIIVESIVSFRMQGVTAPQLERWIRKALLMQASPDLAGGSPRAASSLLARVHADERDTAYVHYLRRSLQVTNDFTHDMTIMPPLAARWNERCAAYRRTMPVEIACAAAGLLALAGWSWFGFRGRSGGSSAGDRVP